MRLHFKRISRSVQVDLLANSGTVGIQARRRWARRRWAGWWRRGWRCARSSAERRTDDPRCFRRRRRRRRPRRQHGQHRQQPSHILALASWFRKAVVHRYRGESSEAENCWRRILTLKRPNQFCSIDQGIYGHLTRRNLAALLPSEATGTRPRGSGTRSWTSAPATRKRGRRLAECELRNDPTPRQERHIKGGGLNPRGTHTRECNPSPGRGHILKAGVSTPVERTRANATPAPAGAT